MKESIEKLNRGGFLNVLKQILSSKYFPFISAAVTLLCYYLGWDIVLIYYISIAGILILVLLDDVTPIIPLFLFMCILVSYTNSPSNAMGNSDYYFKTANLVLIFAALALFISAAIYRVIVTVARKKFRLTPAFWGMCALAVMLFMNGMFSEDYQPKNLLYGLIMAACFLGIFCALKDNIKVGSLTYEKIAFGFLAFSITLITELAVAYITADDIIVEGNINRTELTFGWGIWNTMGMWLVMCIPAVIYLAIKKKYGFVYTTYSVFLCAAVFLTNSRQSMFGAALVYLICIIILLVKGKYKLANLCIIAAAAIAVGVLFFTFREPILKFIKDSFDDFFLNGGLKGNTRMILWQQAFDNYRSAPLFGAGFYVIFTYNANSGLGFIPYMCHNTFLQLLSACGTLGFVAYLIHRAQTVISFCKNVTVERTFIALSILGLLVISLFDNHLFNIFPTIIYSCLAAVLVSGEKKA